MPTTIVIIDIENGEQQEIRSVPIPEGLTPEELSAWIDQTFPDEL